jgi:hypothetical protein
MSHTPTCRIRTEHVAGMDTTYTEPDPTCTDPTHEMSNQ